LALGLPERPREAWLAGLVSGLGLTALVMAALAALISAVLFCQGHLHYPPLLVATVFVAGLVWAWMTIRYRSL
jgi:membrane protease YdiL (CAAX protease family)